MSPTTTTVEPTTTTLPDETTTTTAAPTTTADPTDEEIKQAIIAATINSWEVLNEARLDPTNDEKLAALADVLGGTVLENAANVIAENRVTDERSVTHPEFPAGVVPDPDSVAVDLVTGSATIEACRLGSNILVETGGNPDGSDRIIDDTINSYSESYIFTLNNGIWLWVDGAILEKFEDETECSLDS